MTEQEKQEIVAGVLQALKTNSLTLDQLSETAECSDSDFVELSKGRKISAENLSKHFVDKEFSNISERALSNKVLTGHINKMTTEYNVSVFHPGAGIGGTNEYTLETAIAKIPEQVRNVGIKCSFLDDGGKLQTWEYLGGAWATGNFSQVGAGKLSELDKGKQDRLTFDESPVEGSGNPVTSGGIRQALDAQKKEVDAAKDVALADISGMKDDALQNISEKEQDAISNFSSQRVTPEMLSEATRQLVEQSGEKTINNLPDDEDLTTTGGELPVLKLADRAYNPAGFSGKGYRILRKNIVDGKNVLTQEMVNEPDTVYEIRYDFNLDGGQITIPENCILKFNGGSFMNGTVNCDNTVITADAYLIFLDVVIKGRYSSEGRIEWFKKSSDKYYNRSFKEALTYFTTINLVPQKEYAFDGSVIDCCHLFEPFVINGNNCTFRDFSLAYNIKKDDTMQPNKTSGIRQHVTNIKNVSFYRSGDTEGYLEKPALIISFNIKISSCRFSGYNCCIGITPVYIDTFTIENVDNWDNNNFLACCDYDGNVMADRSFNGDWFFISNTSFGTEQNIIYGGMRNTFCVIFLNCLHGILQLKETDKFVNFSSNIVYMHCHFENLTPCITLPEGSANTYSPSSISMIGCYFYSTAVPNIRGIQYMGCDINVGNNNNLSVGIQRYLNGSYMFSDPAGTAFTVDTTRTSDNTGRLPYHLKNEANLYVNVYAGRGGNLAYAEEVEECYAVCESLRSDVITWYDYENQIVFSEYYTVTQGSYPICEFYFDIENSELNSYLLVFKKIKSTGKIYKSYMYISRELLNSNNNIRRIAVGFFRIGLIGSEWEEYTGEMRYKPLTRTQGTWEQKPPAPKVGFAYFCTDRQTTEGAKNGIVIYYAGNGTWVDALGRIVE